MSVNPGWGGQPFLPGSVEKVRRLRAEAAEAGFRLVVEVDGGVDPGNAADPRGGRGGNYWSPEPRYTVPSDPAAAIGRLRASAEGVRV